MNNFAIIYAGTDLTVAAKMVALKSNILKVYPEINLWYVFDKDIKYFFQEFPLVIDFNTYEEYKNNFTKIFKLESNTKTDCIVDLCNENNINFFISKSKIEKIKNTALITTNTRKDYIQECQIKFPNKMVVDPNLQEDGYLFDAIVGKESMDLIACAAMGKKIYILESNLGFNSFQKMFPDSELFESVNNR
jgi:hypothetical protein